MTPEDILSAAQTLPLKPNWCEVDLISDWTESSVYLNWGRECLELHTPLGWDSALCYAKRAACREIDGFMICNHLSCFLGDTYPAKIRMLCDVEVPIPEIVHELIIDPRNEAEHSYRACTSREAKHAVELAGLFLAATAHERERHPIISINWSIGVQESICTAPGREYHRIEFTMSQQTPPMLLIDVCAEDQRVMVLHPKDSEVVVCYLREFTKNQAATLARLLRKHHVFVQEGNCSYRRVDCDWLNKLKADLAISALLP